MHKIYCIDDDAITLMYCSALIKKNFLNAEVFVAHHGQEALDYYATLANTGNEEQSNYRELIFLDLNLPVMSGWEFLDEFTKSYYSKFPKTKVVILSSSIDPTDQAKAKTYEVVIDFRSKPMTKGMLLELKELYKL